MNWFNRLRAAWIVFRSPVCGLDITYTEHGYSTATLKMILNTPKQIKHLHKAFI